MNQPASEGRDPGEARTLSPLTTPKGFGIMGAAWSRIVNSTIKNYIRDREVNVLRNRKLLALLKNRDRITFNWSGRSLNWRVKYKRVRMTPYADGDTQEFSRKDRNKTAQLPCAAMRQPTR